MLDDPDEEVFLHVKGKLLDLGIDVIPTLENVWEQASLGVVFQNRIEDIVHQIQFEHCLSRLKIWKETGQPDLLEGILLISEYQYPDLNREWIYQFFEKTTQDIWLELNNNLTALEQVRIINHMLFTELGFSANTTHYHSPHNSFINTVLETRKGNPISLCTIYLIVAERLKLPIHGVNLPRHFVLAYIDDGVPFQNMEDPDVLFYINPFSKGTAFSKAEIEYFIKQLQLPLQKAFFAQCSTVQIIERVCNNLIFSYEKLGYQEKVEELKALRAAISE